jgi:hypothetical protein
MSRNLIHATRLIIVLTALVSPCHASARQAESAENEPYESKHNRLLAFPRLIWDGVTYPIAKLVIWEEKHAVHKRVVDFFTFMDGRLGLFPNFSIGGNLGTAVGISSYLKRPFTGNDRVSLSYLYAFDPDNQHGQLHYNSSRIAGGHFSQAVLASYKRVNNDDAVINGEAERLGLLFLLNEWQAEWQLAWKRRIDRLAPFKPNLEIGFTTVYSRTKFLLHEDEQGLFHENPETAALLLDRFQGLGLTEDIVEAHLHVTYDDRDAREPVDSILLPLNYMIPGRFITFADNKYHYWRNIYHPNGGGLITAAFGYGSDFDNIKYMRYQIEIQRFFRLFAKDRTLAFRGQIRRVDPLNDSGVVPYYKQEMLGSNDTLRGYERGSFREHGALLFSVEYRYPIWDYWHAFLFLDEGQVYRKNDQILLDRFEYAAGIGISFRIAFMYLGQLQIAHTEEDDVHVGFSFAHVF